MYANYMERVLLSFELDGIHYKGFIQPYWHQPNFVFSVILNAC